MDNNGNDYYTIVLVNPSNYVSNIGPIVHHMLGNIKGSDLQQYNDINIPSGDQTLIIPYLAPNPVHWYTYEKIVNNVARPSGDNYLCYLIYKQPGGIIDYSAASTERLNWDQAAFANQYNLEIKSTNHFIV